LPTDLSQIVRVLKGYRNSDECERRLDGVAPAAPRIIPDGNAPNLVSDLPNMSKQNFL